METLSSAFIGIHRQLKRVVKLVCRLLIRRRLVLAAICILIAGFLARPVAAQYDAPGETLRVPLSEAFNVLVGASYSYDSNVFRTPGLLVEPQSEYITTGFAGLQIDKPYAQQRFVLNATITAYRYDYLNYLNFDALDYRAAWYWHLTPRVTGTLSADRAEVPTQFQDTRGLRSNVVTTETYLFNVDGWVTGGWHAVLGVSQLYRKSEQSSLQPEPDYSEIAGDAGIRYVFGSGTEISALGRRIEGEQDAQSISGVNVVDAQRYQEDQAELRGSWILNPHSTVTGRATHLERRYEADSQRDFSGMTGELGYAWVPSAKLRVAFKARRNISPYQNLGSNYRVSNTFSLTPAWSVTSKTTISMPLTRTYSNYPVSPLFPGVPERRETDDSARLSVDWQALRALTVSASVANERRSSTDPFTEFNATIAKISASLTF